MLVTFLGIVIMTIFVVVAGRHFGCLYLMMELGSAFLLGYFGRGFAWSRVGVWTFGKAGFLLLFVSARLLFSYVGEMDELRYPRIEISDLPPIMATLFWSCTSGSFCGYNKMRSLSLVLCIKEHESSSRRHILLGVRTSSWSDGLIVRWAWIRTTASTAFFNMNDKAHRLSNMNRSIRQWLYQFNVLRGMFELALISELREIAINSWRQSISIFIK